VCVGVYYVERSANSGFDRGYSIVQCAIWFGSCQRLLGAKVQVFMVRHGAARHPIDPPAIDLLSVDRASFGGASCRS
jgi:hypothetical protein